MPVKWLPEAKDALTERLSELARNPKARKDFRKYIIEKGKKLDGVAYYKVGPIDDTYIFTCDSIYTIFYWRVGSNVEIYDLIWEGRKRK